jgi:hypothetical protein
MTSEALGNRKIPRVYASQVLAAAREHERTNQRRPEWRSLSPDLKRHFAEAADQLASDLGTPPENLDP